MKKIKSSENSLRGLKNKFYHREWYIKNKKKKLAQNKLWYQENKTKHRELVKKYILSHPWVKIASAIKSRCLPNAPYGKLGIKCLITVKEVHKLWMRDKADKMKQPSIDRINTSSNYSFNNCRFIELSENVKRKKRFYLSGWLKHGKCFDCGTNHRRFQAKGRCTLCYTRMRRNLRLGFYHNYKGKQKI